MFDRIEGRVTGLRVRREPDSGDVETIDADLVVDASGRRSHGAAWLDALGYAKPREEGIQVHIG